MQGSCVGSISSDQLEKDLSLCVDIFEIQPAAKTPLPGESLQEDHSKQWQGHGCGRMSPCILQKGVNLHG